MSKVPYSDKLDGEEQVDAEEEIGRFLFDEYGLKERAADEIAEHVLYVVLRRFRPDLFVRHPGTGK